MIWDVEEFDVKITYPKTGAKFRSDKEGLNTYPYSRKAKNDMTVSDWKTNRFYPTYNGYDVEVLSGEGTNETGQKQLGNVRDTYSDD